MVQGLLATAQANLVDASYVHIQHIHLFYVFQIKQINIARIIYYTDVNYPYFILFFGTMKTQRGKQNSFRKLFVHESSPTVSVFGPGR